MTETVTVVDPEEQLVPRDTPGRGRPDARSARRELWVGVLSLCLIGLPTTAVLSVELPERGARFVGLTAAVTAIWFLALRWTASWGRVRGLQPFIAASAGVAIGLVGVSLLDLWLLDALIAPKRLLVLAGLIFLFAGSFQALTARALTSRRRVVVVGGDDNALDLVGELRESGNGGFECVGLVDDRDGTGRLEGAPLLGRSPDLADVVRRERPDLIVCSSVEAHTATVDRLLDACVTSARVVDALEFRELAFQRVPSRHLRPSWFAGVLDIDQQPYTVRAKRLFDISIASLTLLLALPFLLVIPIVLRCSSSDPVLFRQLRIGEGGELFEMLKFRTMVADAEAGEAVWATENDPRVTRVGRVLRKSRLDELPQLVNVLRGDMSLVGPRPERPEFLTMLTRHVPTWSRRHLLKPGITGWAQVHFAYTADVTAAADKFSYDLYYLKHRSLGLDLLILLKTLRVVFSGFGAR